MDVTTDAGISGDAGEVVSNKREDSRREGSIKTLVVQIVYLRELAEGVEEGSPVNVWVAPDSTTVLTGTPLHVVNETTEEHPASDDSVDRGSFDDSGQSLFNLVCWSEFILEEGGVHVIRVFKCLIDFSLEFRFGDEHPRFSLVEERSPGAPKGVPGVPCSLSHVQALHVWCTMDGLFLGQDRKGGGEGGEVKVGGSFETGPGLGDVAFAVFEEKLGVKINTLLQAAVVPLEGGRLLLDGEGTVGGGGVQAGHPVDVDARPDFGGGNNERLLGGGELGDLAEDGVDGGRESTRARNSSNVESQNLNARGIIRDKRGTAQTFEGRGAVTVRLFADDYSGEVKIQDSVVRDADIEGSCFELGDQETSGEGMGADETPHILVLAGGWGVDNGDFTEILRLEGGPVVGVSAHHESGVMGLTEVSGDKKEAGKDVEARHDILAETVAGLDMNDVIGDAGDGGGDALPLDVAGGDGFLGFGFGLLVRDSRVSGLCFLWRVLAGLPQGAGEGDDRA